MTDMILGLDIIVWVICFLIGAVFFHFMVKENCCWGFVACAGGAAFVCSRIFYGAGKNGIISGRGFLIFLFLAVLMTVAVTDYKIQKIHHRFHMMILLLGIVAVWLFPEYRIVDRCIGTIAISVPMFLIALMLPGAFGGGDIKLMAVCGWLLGFRSIVYAMVVAIMAGGMYCIIQLLRRKISRKDSLAFAPWLAVGLVAACFLN